MLSQSSHVCHVDGNNKPDKGKEVTRMNTKSKQFCRKCGRVITGENRCQQCGVLERQEVVSLAVERHDRLSQLSEVERAELRATVKQVERAFRHRHGTGPKPRISRA